MREGALENRSSPQDRGLARVQKAITPIERGLEASLAWRPTGRSMVEKIKAVLEPAPDVGGAKSIDSCRRQLDRQRKPLQSGYELTNRHRIITEIEQGIDRGGPLDKQLYRVEGPDLIGIFGVGVGGHGHGLDRPHNLTVDAQWLTTGGQHLRSRCGSEQSLDQRRGLIDQCSQLSTTSIIRWSPMNSVSPSTLSRLCAGGSPGRRPRLEAPARDEQWRPDRRTKPRQVRHLRGGSRHE